MRRLFYLVVALQVLFLVAEAVTSQMALERGRIVVLKTVPVDPRSMFMGNYMALSYEISTVHLESVSLEVTDTSRLREGATVYVGLDPGKPYARLRALRVDRPPRDTGIPFLRGRIADRYDSTIHVVYGLERYYIPEEEQEFVNELQWREARRPEIAVEVAIKQNGEGLIRRVLVDGKPLKF